METPNTETNWTKQIISGTENQQLDLMMKRPIVSWFSKQRKMVYRLFKVSARLGDDGWIICGFDNHQKSETVTTVAPNKLRICLRYLTPKNGWVLCEFTDEISFCRAVIEYLSQPTEENVNNPTFKDYSKTTTEARRHDVQVLVKLGDISNFAADALITAINSGGIWFGGIDGIIQRSAGNQFHSQAAAAMPLRHGQTITAKGNRSCQGTFKNVVFVVDDLKGPLHEIIRNGLQAAAEAGYATVTVPTIRMGVMLGAVEKSVGEATSEMARGVSEFLTNNLSSSIKQITFVVYNDAATQAQLEKDLQN